MVRRAAARRGSVAQGKYVEQVSGALREYGVEQVRVEAKAGLVSKKDKAVNV